MPPKRVIPTIVPYDTSGNINRVSLTDLSGNIVEHNGTNYNIRYQGKRGFNIMAGETSSVRYGFVCQWTADAEF